MTTTSPRRRLDGREGVLIGKGWMRIRTPMPEGGHRNMLVLYDLADAELIEQFSWHIRPDHQTFYAAASVPVTRIAPLDRRDYVYMHQLVLGRGEGRISHLNGNGLDNRRKNLARMNQSQVLAKRRPPALFAGKTPSSPYKGVCRDKETGKWLATFRGKKVGRFRDEAEAARAWDAAARAYWGPLAYQNFPES